MFQDLPILLLRRYVLELTDNYRHHILYSDCWHLISYICWLLTRKYNLTIATDQINERIDGLSPTAGSPYISSRCLFPSWLPSSPLVIPLALPPGELVARLGLMNYGIYVIKFSFERNLQAKVGVTLSGT